VEHPHSAPHPDLTQYLLSQLHNVSKSNSDSQQFTKSEQFTGSWPLKVTQSALSPPTHTASSRFGRSNDILRSFGFASFPNSFIVRITRRFKQSSEFVDSPIHPSGTDLESIPLENSDQYERSPVFYRSHHFIHSIELVNSNILNDSPSLNPSGDLDSTKMLPVSELFRQSEIRLISMSIFSTGSLVDSSKVDRHLDLLPSLRIIGSINPEPSLDFIDSRFQQSSLLGDSEPRVLTLINDESTKSSSAISFVESDIYFLSSLFPESSAFSFSKSFWNAETHNEAADETPGSSASTVIAIAAALFVLILIAGVLIAVWRRRSQQQNLDDMNYEIETEFQEEHDIGGEFEYHLESNIPFGDPNHMDHEFSDGWDIFRVTVEESNLGFMA
jgi:hypothetical protein